MKRPSIISFAGPGSNSGKTTLVVRLIEALAKDRPVGALKMATATPDHLCARTGLPCGCLQFDGKMRLLTDRDYIEKEGKDTQRFLAAGANPVWWLQTTSDFQVEATRETVSRLDGPDLWLVEGAGPIRAGLADLNVLVATRDGREAKPGYLELIPHADLVLASDHEATESLEALRERLTRAGLSADVPILELDAGALPAALVERAQSLT